VSRPKPLTNDEIADALAGLPKWELRDGALRRQYRFASFTDAFAWMAAAALEAQGLDHHPDWRNVYGRVDVALSTHDPRGITDLDLTLARRMDAYAALFVAGGTQPLTNKD
jgi:4a-hydroxytetrahydrobiopterin dehydratase